MTTPAATCLRCRCTFRKAQNGQKCKEYFRHQWAVHIQRQKNYPCIVCGTKYDSDEHAASCQWIHIIRNDKYIQRFTKKSG